MILVSVVSPCYCARLPIFLSETKLDKFIKYLAGNPSEWTTYRVNHGIIGIKW